MVKLGILLLLMICVQVSLAGIASDMMHSNKETAKRVMQIKMGLNVKQRKPWNYENNEHRWSGKRGWRRGESGEEQDYSDMSNDEMSEMMIMKMRRKMKRMFQPLRDLFVKVNELQILN
jgi:hypothetical protein